MSTMDNQPHSHNASAQQHVQINNDPALDTANEHVHGHLHHTANAEKGRDETEYSKGTTYEADNIPSQHPHDQAVPGRNRPDDSTIPAATPDAEKGGFSRDDSQEDPRTHTVSNFYLRHRIFLHAFIWLFFTGFVDLPASPTYRVGTFSAEGDVLPCPSLRNADKQKLVDRRTHPTWPLRFYWLSNGLVEAVSVSFVRRSCRRTVVNDTKAVARNFIAIFFLYVPITIITKPMHFVWNNVAVRLVGLIPEKMRLPLGAVVVVGVLVIGAFASPESLDNNRANRAVSLFGLAVM